MNLIEARGLHKRYGSVPALDDFHLSLAPGQILGLIGPNGSGKTTALKTFLGLCPLDGGEVKVLGRNPRRDRKGLMAHVGYIADVGILPRWMRNATRPSRSRGRVTVVARAQARRAANAAERREPRITVR